LTPRLARATNPVMTEAPANIPEYTVSEISMAVKRTVEDVFGHVRVRGEISGYRGPHSSGHAYFALKDERARVEAVVWRSTFGRLRFKPEEGLEVIATGRLTTFPGSSKYQIVIDALEPAGAGALMALLEQRRKALAAEGLFDEARKQPLPFLPRVIGVVTSPTGAVIRDILHRLADRFPVHVEIWPVRVQGETSASEVAAAIAGFNALAPGGAIKRPDVLIVARGGGSLEDLWGFNEEIVVRAAAASDIPIIAAVGHETDWTLIDHVADRRAPTPTGAAEMAVPVRSELLAAVDGCGSRLAGVAFRRIEAARRELRAAARVLPRAEDLFAVARRALDELSSRLGRSLIANSRIHRTQFERAAVRLSPTALSRSIERARERTTALSQRSRQAITRLIERAKARNKSAAKLLDALSYRKVLERGFALVTADGLPVRSVAAVAPGAALDIEFHDGHVGATANSREAAAKRLKPPAAKDPQGSLF
jgi:exodeoxyribonuclease VII large subunit